MKRLLKRIDRYFFDNNESIKEKIMFYGIIIASVISLTITIVLNNS